MMRVNRILFSLVVILSFALTRLSLAQENGELPKEKKEGTKFNLGQIVVTATKTERAIGDIPASVTVIGRETIDEYSNKRLEDVLATAPGVDQQGNYTYGRGRSDVYMRGINDVGKMLMMVDGVPINNSWHGEVEWNQIPLENIERIEIVRGSASSLYGSQAMGGVINIITREPEKGHKIRFKQDYGSLSTWMSFLSMEGRTEKIGYYLSGKYNASDGYISHVPQQSYDIKSNYNLDNIDGKLFYFFDEESSLKMGFSHLDRKFGRGREYSNVDRSIDKGHLIYHGDLGRFDWLASFYLHNETQKVEFDTAPTYSYLNLVEKFHLPFYGGMLQSAISLSDWNTLTLGFEYKHSKIDKEDEYQTSSRRGETKGKQRYLSLYVQDEMSFFDERFKVVIGGRQDWWENFDGSCYDTDPPGATPAININYDDKSWSSFNPKLGLLYHFTERTALRSSVSRGFRAPSLPRLYTIMTRGLRTIYGNPDLNPETLISYEVGVDHSFTDGLEGKLTFYQSDGDDFIGTRTTAPNRLDFDNINKVRMRGIETELKYKITEKWSSFFNYTYNKSTVEKDVTDPTIEGNFLGYIPQHKLNLGIVYDNPRLFTLSSLLKYVGSKYTDLKNTEKLDGYWTFDVKISRDIGKNVKLAFGCENILDKKYDVDTEMESPGRLFTGSLEVLF
ncbi:MAG: TonB-dependent receptor [Candidatus Omnitrophica bacterium]|nr:TonB-dependent receptor [Candidatus Omnitrophota bacterium]